MSDGWDYTLEAFVKERVATGEEWSDWQRVRLAKAPGTTPTWQGQDLVHVPELPSPEFTRRQELVRLWAERTPMKILEQEWEVSARKAGDLARHPLERADIEGSTINFDRWTIGHLQDVRLRRRLQSKFEAMTDFVEKVCLKVNPGAKLTKPVIEILAKQLCGENYSDDAFAAAWAEADIDDRWRRKGPR